MKKIIYTLTLGILLASCQKEMQSTPKKEVNPADIKLAADFSYQLQQNGWHLTKYYSDTPIDYVDTDDVVRSETDLWRYVSFWLIDDYDQFYDGNQISIGQGNLAMPGTDQNVSINGQWAVTADTLGVKFHFMNFQYQPADYRLISRTDTSFVIEGIWSGKKVKSQFDKY